MPALFFMQLAKTHVTSLTKKSGSMPDYFVMRGARVRQIRGFSSPNLKGVYYSTRPKTRGAESREDGVLLHPEKRLSRR